MLAPDNATMLLRLYNIPSAHCHVGRYGVTGFIQQKRNDILLLHREIVLAVAISQRRGVR